MFGETDRKRYQRLIDFEQRLKDGKVSEEELKLNTASLQ